MAKGEEKKKKGSWMMGFSVTVSALVALVAILFSMPFPELQWDEFVVPNAIEYMEKVMGVVWDDSSSSSISNNTAIMVGNKQQPLRGMYIVVTGATSGIGLGLTRKLCLLGATVVALGRSSSKLQQLQQEWPQNIETVLADFSDLDSIATASQYMIERYDRLDMLVNNAGIHPGFSDFSQSKQGYDLTFAEKLMPVLKKSVYPKVVQIASGFHYAVDGSDLSTHQGTRDPIASQKGGSHGFLLFRGQRQYCNSKFAQLMHARSLRQHHGIRAVSACPAWVGTQIGQKNGTLAHSFFEATAFPMEGYGLSSILYAILDPKIETSEDDFYVNIDFFHGMPNPFDWMPSWTYETIPIRDMIAASGAYSVAYILQRFWAIRGQGMAAKQSYDPSLQEELYTWSRQAVAQWL